MKKCDAMNVGEIGAFNVTGIRDTMLIDIVIGNKHGQYRRYQSHDLRRDPAVGLFQQALSAALDITVEGIHTPKITVTKQRPSVRFIARILADKAAAPNADTATLEAEIDRRIYAMYRLTEDEIAAVEGG